MAGVVAAIDEPAPSAPTGTLVAPGRDVPTTAVRRSRWATVSGASYAAAHVSGLLALMLELRRRSGRRQPARRRAISSCGADGRVDACASLGRAGAAARVLPAARRRRWNPSRGTDVRRGSLRRGRQLHASQRCCLGASLAAQAQLGASVAVDSDYRFRGVSLERIGTEPARRVQLRRAERLLRRRVGDARRARRTGDRYVQVLGYAGCATPIGVDRQVEAGATFSHFTGDSSYDFAEVLRRPARRALGARGSTSRPTTSAADVSTVYAELDAHTLLDEQLPAVRPRRRDRRGSPATAPARAARRGDLRLGAGWIWRGLDLQLAWVAATRGGPYPAVYGGRRSAWVAGASYSF